MNESVKIFVEGEADIKFISDYISYLFGKDFENIQKLGGWEGIKDEGIRNQFRINTDNQGRNILIIDADSNVEERRKQSLSILKTNGITADLFLFPNNTDQGDLETLLESIINNKNHKIFECWTKYENCLSGIKIEGRDESLTIPAKKSKIYSYIEALVGDSRSQKKLIKDPSRDYKNSSHWDLDSDSLSSLKKFLENSFS